MELCVECGAHWNELAQREEAADRRERRIKVREKFVNKQVVAVKCREKALAERVKVVKKREEAAKRREKTVQQREEEVKKREECFKKQEKRINLKRKALKKREDAIKKRGRMVRRRLQELKQLRAATEESPASHFETLPDEVLEKIFSFLKTDYIIPNILSVCTRWRDVAEDRILSKELVFRGDAFPTEDALRLINAAPKLQLLVLQHRDDAVALMQAASITSTKLLRLSIVSCYGRRSAVTAVLCDVIRNCSHLTDISLSEVSVAKSLQFCRQMGSALPHLRKLHISCSWFNAPELNAILESCSQMQELWAPHCQCSDENIVKMVQHWRNSLQVLGLNALQMTVTSLALLAQCSQLVNLKLTYLNTSGMGLQHLTSLTQLDNLDLSSPIDILPEDFLVFFSQSQSASRLRSLNLSFCFVLDDSVLFALAATCPLLEDLRVASCRNVTCLGLRRVLQSCHQLRHLDIRGTHESVTKVVPDLPQLAPQLRYLHIGNIEYLRKSALDLIHTKMPRLEIEWGT